jgi:membrane protein
MDNPFAVAFQRVADWIWKDDRRDLKGVRRLVIVSLRMTIVVSRQLLGGQLTLRAMSLVYTTLLSTVPLLAVSFSVLKGFGVHNQLEPMLLNFLAPLGPRGNEVATNVLQFVENIKVGVLGSLGLVFLLYTVVSLAQKVESAFNFVWQVDRLRRLSERFSSYLTVILIGPVLMFAALGITATVANNSFVQQLVSIKPLGDLVLAGSRLLPYLMVIGGFTFLYLFIPNTRVKLLPAAVGGAVAGILWQTSGWGFAAFVVSSSKYAAIYSGFAILILLLIWLYVSWLILLLGVQVAFYVQHPQYVTRRQISFELSNRMRERLALQVMYLVTEHYIDRRDPWTLDAMVRRLGLPMQPVRQMLHYLIESGFVVQTSDDPPAYVPRYDSESITLAQLLEAVRKAGESGLLTPKTLPPQLEVERTMDTARAALESRLGAQTLRDLVSGTEKPN